MYRDYEDPRELEAAIIIWEDKYETAVQLGASEKTLRGIHEYIEELKERARFAWADEEFDEEV